MHALSVSSRLLPGLLLAALSSFVHAHGEAISIPAVAARDVPRALAVRGELKAPPRGVAELKFGEIFRLPVGPQGLEPSEKLASLDGKRVRMVGYLVPLYPPADDRFLLSPLAVDIGHEDESLADNIPPTAVMVQLPTAAGATIPRIPGLIQLTGTLSVGSREDAASGRVSPVQLTLDAPAARTLRRVSRDAAKAAEPRHRH